MTQNIFKDCTDQEMMNIALDIKNSREQGKRPETLVPDAQAIKDNINSPGRDDFNLREALELVKTEFYEEMTERFGRYLKEAKYYKSLAKSAIAEYLEACELTHDEILDALAMDDEEFKDVMGYELEKEQDEPER